MVPTYPSPAAGSEAAAPRNPRRWTMGRLRERVRACGEQPGPTSSPAGASSRRDPLGSVAPLRRRRSALGRASPDHFPWRTYRASSRAGRRWAGLCWRPEQSSNPNLLFRRRWQIV